MDEQFQDWRSSSTLELELDLGDPLFCLANPMPSLFLSRCSSFTSCFSLSRATGFALIFSPMKRRFRYTRETNHCMKEPGRVLMVWPLGPRRFSCTSKFKVVCPGMTMGVVCRSMLWPCVSALHPKILRYRILGPTEPWSNWILASTPHSIFRNADPARKY